MERTNEPTLTAFPTNKIHNILFVKFTHLIYTTAASHLFFRRTQFCWRCPNYFKNRRQSIKFGNYLVAIYWIHVPTSSKKTKVSWNTTPSEREKYLTRKRYVTRSRLGWMEMCHLTPHSWHNASSIVQELRGSVTRQCFAWQNKTKRT